MADAKLARQWRDPAAELAFLHTRQMGGADAWIATDRGAQLLYPHVLGAVSPKALSATVVFSLDFPTDPSAGGPGEGLGTPGTSTGEDRWTARLNELAVQDLTTPIDRAPGRSTEGKNEKGREAFYPFASLDELEEYMQEKMAEKLDLPQSDVEVFSSDVEEAEGGEGERRDEVDLRERPVVALDVDLEGEEEVEEDAQSGVREEQPRRMRDRGRRSVGSERHVVIDREALQGSGVSAVANAFEAGTPRQVWGKWEEEAALRAGTQFRNTNRKTKFKVKRRKEQEVVAENETTEGKPTGKAEGGGKQAPGLPKRRNPAEVARRQRARQQVIEELQQRTRNSRCELYLRQVLTRRRSLFRREPERRSAATRRKSNALLVAALRRFGSRDQVCADF
eukprot:g20279.t1